MIWLTCKVPSRRGMVKVFVMPSNFLFTTYLSETNHISSSSREIPAKKFQWFDPKIHVCQLHLTYCLWKKSCPSWHSKYAIIYRLLSQLVIAGFLNHQQYDHLYSPQKARVKGHLNIPKRTQRIENSFTPMGYSSPETITILEKNMDFV